MNMCFGAKNCDSYRQEKNDRSIDERSSSETKIDRNTEPSESVLHEINNPDETRNYREKLSGATGSEKFLPTSEKKLRIFESDKSIDGTFDSETNIVRTVNRSVGNVKIGEIVRFEVKKKIVNDVSSKIEKNRETKDFGVKNSEKFVVEEKKRLMETERSEGVLHEINNIDGTPNRIEKLSGATSSEIFLPTSEKKLRIFESEKSFDGTFDSETNIVRTVNGNVGDVKIGKILRSELKKKIVNDESSRFEINRGTKDFGVKNSKKNFFDEKKRLTETERFVGDGLSLRIDVNERDIEVTGDGCRLTLATNRGRIRMIGDGCRLQIGRNSGDIEYTGDGGRVSLGPDSTGTNVLYVGDGGRVDIADGKIRTGTRDSTASGRGLSSTGVKRNVERSSEIFDNVLNERRARRTSKTTCKTVRIVNIDTKVISNGGTNKSTRAEKSCSQCV